MAGLRSEKDKSVVFEEQESGMSGQRCHRHRPGTAHVGDSETMPSGWPLYRGDGWRIRSKGREQHGSCHQRVF